MSFPDYESDAAAMLAQVQSALALPDTAVEDIGALDPEQYMETTLNVGGSTLVYVAWVRWLRAAEFTNNTPVWSQQYAVSVVVNEQRSFADCLQDAGTLRDRLHGFQFRIKGGNLRTLAVEDGTPRFGENYDIKAIQFFVDVQ